MLNEPDDINAFVRAIAAYLVRYPEAGDTVEGIALWWLGADSGDWPRVRLALQAMEGKGMVSRLTGADGREHYRAGPALQRPLSGSAQ